MNRQKADLIKELFTNPSNTTKDLSSLFDSTIIRKFKLRNIDENNKCNYTNGFENIKELQSGTYATALYFCIDSDCKLPLVLRITNITTNPGYIYWSLDFNDKRRPENTEANIFKKVCEKLSIVNKNNELPHYPEFIDSFICNTYLHRAFKKFIMDNTREIKKLENKLDNLAILDKKSEENKINDHYYRITIMEYATDGTLESIIRKVDPKTYKSCIFQALAILSLLDKYYPDFRHNDYHTGNLLVKKWDNTLKYELYGKKYNIINPKYCVMINDFDYATDSNNKNVKALDSYINIDYFTSLHDAFKFLNTNYDDINYEEKTTYFYDIIDFTKNVIPNDLLSKNVFYDNNTSMIIKINSDNGIKPYKLDKKRYKRLVNTYNFIGDDDDLDRYYVGKYKKYRTLKEIIEHEFFDEFREKSQNVQKEITLAPYYSKKSLDFSLPKLYEPEPMDYLNKYKPELNDYMFDAGIKRKRIKRRLKNNKVFPIDNDLKLPNINEPFKYDFYN